MARSRRSRYADVIRVVTGSVFIGYLLFMGYWDRLSDAQKTLLIISAVIVIGGGGILLWVFLRYQKRKRAEAWERAMNAWKISQRMGTVPNVDSARRLTPDELERFAAQVFSKMGYRILSTGHSGDHGIDVKMVNPNGQIELVQCKQWYRVVGEKEIRDFSGAMGHEGAVRGFFWAPGGFSKDAERWGKGKPIVFADDREIGRLVESAYGG